MPPLDLYDVGFVGAVGAGGGETRTLYDGTGSSGGLNGGSISASGWQGMRFLDGADPFGHLLIEFSFWLTTLNDNIDHELSAHVINSLGTTIEDSTNTINNNTLNQESTPLSLGDFTEETFTFDGTYTIADGDRLVLKNTMSSTALRQAQTYVFATLPNPVYCSIDDCPLTSHQIYMSVTWA